MTDKSATEQLREMLDERGVEYETDDRNGLRETTWCGTAAFQLSPTAKMTMIVTPEQAIAATLGNSRAERTCHIEWCDDSYDTDAGYERDGAYFCTACRAELPYPLQECWDDYQAGNYEKPFNYCPNCGARRVGE